MIQDLTISYVCSGLFGDFDWKEFLQKEFNIDMSDI